MKELVVKDILEVCKGRLVLGDENTIVNNFSIDTRTIKLGDVYVGIKGNNFDGNLFYKEALDKGCKGCILGEDTIIDDDIDKDKFIILVKDTVEALSLIATYKRNLLDLYVIAITGSSGKTSTRDIIFNVIAKKYKTLKTIKNYNNKIGVSLTLLNLEDHEVLVVELGMNNLGEISELSRMVRPNVAVITNIGTAHIGNLNSKENILKAKLEILEGMKEKVLIINNDDQLLHNYYLDNKNKEKFITYGISNDSMYKAYDIRCREDYSEFRIDNNLFRINVPGKHFVMNSLCAYAIARFMDIDKEDIKEGLSNFDLTDNRMEIVSYKGIKIINDCYNANLDSMKYAIEYLGKLKGRKIAILGDMLELGSYSKEYHEKLGNIVEQNKIDILILVGNDIKYTKDECIRKGLAENKIYYFMNNEEA